MDSRLESQRHMGAANDFTMTLLHQAMREPVRMGEIEI